MRIARNLTLLACMASAALLLSTASASAALSVKKEQTGVNCGSVTQVSHGTGSGGCLLHANSNGAIELGAYGLMIVCDTEFEGRIGTSGAGYIYGMTLTNCSDPVVPCQEPGGVEVWSGELTSETTVEIHFCVVMLGMFTVECTIEGLPLTEDDPGHMNGTVSTGPQHVDCDENGFSVSGSWVFETDTNHPEVEVVD
jgi:hypothetical protein